MMKFNPITQKLKTKRGALIKKLHCPKNANWESMHPETNGHSRLCSQCERQVTDINGMRTRHVRELLVADPNACLKLELDYSNLRVVTTDD